MKNIENQALKEGFGTSMFLKCQNLSLAKSWKEGFLPPAGRRFTADHLEDPQSSCVSAILSAKLQVPVLSPLAS